MNIKAIRLTNFRGFRDARIELKPLTVLIGPNSAGKSSFGQALAALAHVQHTYAGTPQASLTPPPNVNVDDWPVDLGTTNDLRTVGTEGEVRIALETSAGSVELGFGGLAHTQDLLLSFISHVIRDQSTAVGTTVNAPIITYPHSQITGAVPVGGTFKDISSLVELKKVDEGTWREGANESSVILDGLILRAVTHMTGTARPLDNVAQQELRRLFENLTYLRANRKRPARGYRQGVSRPQAIGYSGEYTASILHERGKDIVDYLIPSPSQIPLTVEEAKEKPFTWETKRATLHDALQEWLSHIDLADSIETIVPSSTKDHVMMRVGPKGCTAHDITEVGFGISQIVPVLVAGLLQPEDSLFIVDLPEAHLHPRPQAAVADFFCSLALSGRSVLVETHSEMFFHRLRLRAAMNPTLMENIAVYCIDKPTSDHCNDPRLMGLRFEDELRWPEGFLHEALEIELQINAVREAIRINANDSTSA